MINDILTVSEAAREWQISEGTIRAAIRVGKFINNVDYRKSGGTLLITKRAMEKVYGPIEHVLKKVIICEVCGKEIGSNELVAVFTEDNKTHYFHALKDCEYEYMRKKLSPKYVPKSEI